MTRDELEKLTKEELIELVLEQAQRLTEVEEVMVRMSVELEKLRQAQNGAGKPPPTSKNSSQPPCRDQKANKPKESAKRKHGRGYGHAKAERQWVAEPDEVVALKPEQCASCQGDLRHAVAKVVAVNQITELPEPKAKVIEVRQYEVHCPECGHSQVAEPPEGLEMERVFGSRLEATIVYYRQQQHMSYERTQKALQDLHGVELSQGAINRMMGRVGRAAQAALKPIEAAVRHSAVVNSDETGVRVAGRTWWHWVFCTLTAVLHVIKPSRAAAVIDTVMADSQVEVWGSDCLPAQLKADRPHRQLCLAHQNRNLQRVIDQYPQGWWARAVQTLFRAAISLHHLRDQLSVQQFQAHRNRLEQLSDWLLTRSPPQAEALKLHKRYLKHRQHLFVFLYRTDLEPTNNVAERALRPAVIHRKVTNGFRSQWGADAYVALASVIDTAKLQGHSPFDAIQQLFPQPAFPIPLQPSCM
jgi:transposase